MKAIRVEYVGSGSLYRYAPPPECEVIRVRDASWEVGDEMFPDRPDWYVHDIRVDYDAVTFVVALTHPADGLPGWAYDTEAFEERALEQEESVEPIAAMTATPSTAPSPVRRPPNEVVQLTGPPAQTTPNPLTNSTLKTYARDVMNIIGYVLMIALIGGLWVFIPGCDPTECQAGYHAEERDKGSGRGFYQDWVCVPD